MVRHMDVAPLRFLDMTPSCLVFIFSRYLSLIIAFTSKLEYVCLKQDPTPLGTKYIDGMFQNNKVY